MIVAMPILLIVGLVYSLFLPHLVEGMVNNATAFGLPENNTFVFVLFAIVFGFIAALMVGGPFIVSVKEFRKRK